MSTSRTWVLVLMLAHTVEAAVWALSYAVVGAAPAEPVE